MNEYIVSLINTQDTVLGPLCKQQPPAPAADIKPYSVAGDQF